MKLEGYLVIFSLITLVGSSNGMGISTYLITFDNGEGITLPIWVTQGDNVSLMHGWDGNAMYVKNSNKMIRIDIFNRDSNNHVIFSYPSIKKIYFQWWIVATGHFESKTSICLGSVRNGITKYYNFMQVIIEGEGYGAYHHLKITNLGIVWGKSGGYTQFELLYSNSDGSYIDGYFTTEVNLLYYPKYISFELDYPSNNGTLSISKSISNPYPIGRISGNLTVGRNSPFCINTTFPISDDVNIGLMIDNINLDYLPLEDVNSGTSYYSIIVTTTMVALPVVVFLGLKRLFFAKFK